MAGAGCVCGGGVSGRGACMAVGCAWQRGMCGGGHAWQVRGMHGRGHAWLGHVWQRGVSGMGTCIAGLHAWQERWPLQHTVCILLECILVVQYFTCKMDNHLIIIPS